MSSMRVCVFGSSSNRTPVKYLHESEALGGLIAEGGHVCVNGGGAFGCMGALNKGAHDKNGQILGVIHEMFVVEEEDKRIQKMMVSKGDTLSERKQMLVSNSDCIIVLPGGVGTLDEMWEAACNRSLRLGGMEKIPICILNIEGYYDGSLAQLDRAFEDSLLYQSPGNYFHVETDPAAAIAWCKQAVAEAQKDQQESADSKNASLSNSKSRMTLRSALHTYSFMGGLVVGLAASLTLIMTRSKN